MLAYIIRRLLFLPVVIFGASLLIFLMLYALPPEVRVFAFVHGEDVRIVSKIPELIAKYHLDDPIYLQYWRWLQNVAHGDLGWSTSANMPVMKALLDFFPFTLQLVVTALIPMLVGGIWLGIKSAVHHNKLIDHLTRFMSITGYSLPSFVLGLVLLMIFYGALHLFGLGFLGAQYLLIWQDPSQFHIYTRLTTLDALLNGRWDMFLDALQHLVLPALTLTYINWALLVRITRSSMLNTLREDYVTTARAKGLLEKVVINKHASRNAMIPVLTVSGFLVASLLGGVVITETIFSYKGIGWFFINAANRYDASAVLGFTLFSGFLWVFANLFVDVFYAIIDPRVRLA
jgi:peptide/nickel transport system permease protein